MRDLHVGFPLLHQNEILFAQPVGSAALADFAYPFPADDAATLERFESIDRKIDKAASVGEQLVKAMRQAQHELSISFEPFVRHLDFLSLLDTRNEVIDHIERIEGHIADTERDAASVSQAHERLIALMEIQPKLQLRHRRQQLRFLDAHGKVQRQRRAYVEFIRSQLLPKLDARLHDTKPPEHPFGDAMNDLIDRYPVIAEYLAR